MHFRWTSDRRLVDKALTGDFRAAKKLVDDYYPGVVRFLIHLTGRIDDAEEIAQETFVRAWQGLGSFRGRSTFRTWIHHIAYREFLAHRRNAKRGEEWFDSAPDKNADFVDELVSALALEQAILTLPVELRITLLLVYVEGLSAAETASILEIPRGTVLSRISTARARLRRPLVSSDPNQRQVDPDPKAQEGPNPHEITQFAPKL